jgi:hypothetical protein
MVLIHMTDTVPSISASPMGAITPKRFSSAGDTPKVHLETRRLSAANDLLF